MLTATSSTSSAPPEREGWHGSPHVGTSVKAGVTGDVMRFVTRAVKRWSVTRLDGTFV